MGGGEPEASNLVSSDTEVPVFDLSLRNYDAPVCEPCPENRLESYQYSPLPKTDKTIRLLCVLPANNIADPLFCQMHQVRLIDKPEYAALSYTWGAPIFDHHLICDGRRLAITAHLDAALRTFRRTSWCMLWVDAVCIDQTNIPERNHQVSIMKHIYFQATMTFVYLGEACLQDEVALGLMWTLGNLAQLSKTYSLAELKNTKPHDRLTPRMRDVLIRFIELKDAGFPTSFPAASTGTTDSSSAGIPPPTHSAWEAMQSLFSRPWFSRMWIIQEVVMSSDVLMMLGKFCFPWRLVTDSVSAYLDLGLLHVTKLPNMTVAGQFQESGRVVLSLLKVKHEFPCRSLIKLLGYFRKCYSSDPRDKVYALLGLANDWALHQVVSVDYSKSVEAVHLECAQYLVRNGNGMEMLTMAGITGKRIDTDLKPSLPSWVPDWSEEGPSYIGAWQNHYQAGGETQIDMELEDGGNRLNAKGIRIDVIDALAPLFGGHVRNPYDINSWEQKVREVAQQSRYFSEERVDGYAKTLGLGLCTTADFDAFQNEGLASDTEYDERVFFAACHLKFCVTRRGYMGWVPLASQPGDFIIVLYGGPMPLIVRANNGNYLLLGASYIEGLMNGEALRLEDAGQEEVVLE